MSNYQNVGTFDAGIVARPGASGGAMTMDAAGIASGQAFLVSELEKRDPIIRKPLTSVTYPRDIVVKAGGGWVDFASAQSVGYGITGGSGVSPIQAGGSNGLPIVQANMEKVLHEIGTTYPPNVAAIYLLSATPETRDRFWDMVDLDGNFIDDCWDSWQELDLDSRRCVALAANLACNGGSYPELSPAYLYSSPLAPVFRCAVDYGIVTEDWFRQEWQQSVSLVPR